jgi:hypothetical protein
MDGNIYAKGRSNVFYYRVEGKAKPLKLPLSIDRLESFFRSDFSAETSEPAKNMGSNTDSRTIKEREYTICLKS